MTWTVEFLKEAVNDLSRLDPSVRVRALKGICKIAQNPLPQTEGGYGRLLGRRDVMDLVGLLTVKLRADGIRVVYRIVRAEKDALVVVGVRTDSDVYREAVRRRKKHGF